MAESGGHVVVILVIAAAVLFWIGMLGLLWRRSLVGMLIGIFFAWISVAMISIGFSISAAAGADGAERSALGGVLVLCVSAIACLQLAIGMGIVVARIRRRGSLDADDAGLLEG